MTLNYNPNVPLITDTFSAWQPEFLMNFAQLFNAFSQNHVPLNAASNAGNHNYIDLFEQTSPQQTNIGEFAAYTKLDQSTTDQIFMRYQGNGTEFQFSCYQIYNLPSTTLQTPYFTFLPGKIICYFGLFIPKINAPESVIILNPPIARNIISVNLTQMKTTGNFVFSSTVSLVKNTNGIITGLKLSPGISGPPDQYYIVLANI